MDALNTAVNFVCTQEGFAPNSYKDSGGVDTVGFGFTGKMHDGRDVKDVRNLSADEAKMELTYRIKGLILSIKTLCGKIELNENQTAALVSFAYNIGLDKFSKSMLMRKIKSEDFLAASDEFQRWALCNGKPLLGLKRRRHREAILFLS